MKNEIAPVINDLVSDKKLISSLPLRPSALTFAVLCV
jgi:hypothetical protein